MTGVQTCALPISLRDGRERIEPYRNPNSVLLACAPDFAGGWLISRLRQLRGIHPSMEVWLITQDELREIDRIDVDLIISSQELTSTELSSVKLIDDVALAVCGPELARRLHALPFPEVLQAVPLIIDETYPEWAPWMAEQKIVGKRGITLEDTRLRLQAAENELGIAMISKLAAEDALHNGRLVALTQIPSVPLAQKWLTKSNLLARTPAVEIVFEWLRTQGHQGIE